MALLLKIFDPLNNKTRRVLLHHGSLLTLSNCEFCYFFRIKNFKKDNKLSIINNRIRCSN
jgi:hypothetical protein